MRIINLEKKISGESGFNLNLISDLNLEIINSNIYTILAPANAGKSTLLKIISGLKPYSGGEMNLARHTKPVYIPSENASFPWFNVSENFNLVSQKQELNSEIIKLIGLEGYEKHYPDNNSRGFRFLISVGMALLSGTDLLLIDDPFYGLTDLMKIRIVSVLRNIVEQKKNTIIIATSNISDSILASDKIFIMKSNPLAVDEELNVPFAGVRKLEHLQTKEAEELKKRIVGIFSKQNIEREINISI